MEYSGNNPLIELLPNGDIKVWDPKSADPQKPVTPERESASFEEITAGFDVKNAEAMTVVRLEGSCFWQIWWRGRWWRFRC